MQNPDRQVVHWAGANRPAAADRGFLPAFVSFADPADGPRLPAHAFGKLQDAHGVLTGTFTSRPRAGYRDPTSDTEILLQEGRDGRVVVDILFIDPLRHICTRGAQI